MPAWNGWYHLMANTYGTWLPGDPRGFRTRAHREHVEGDYKSPPAEDYSARHAAAEQSLKRDPVVLSPQARRVAVEALRVRLHEMGCEVLAAAVSSRHLHVLLRVQSPRIAMRGLSKSNRVREGLDPLPRHVLGVAKKHTAHVLSSKALVSAGGVWAKRGKIKPIRDRAHQLNTFHYILDHEKEGAATWSFNDKPKKKPTD
ncbi:MAG: hypothetical protein AAF823_04040 [Planctomycetota bacterium]